MCGLPRRHRRRCRRQNTNACRDEPGLQRVPHHCHVYRCHGLQSHGRDDRLCGVCLSCVWHPGRGGCHRRSESASPHSDRSTRPLKSIATAATRTQVAPSRMRPWIIRWSRLNRVRPVTMATMTVAIPLTSLRPKVDDEGHFVTSVAACASCHTSTTAWTPVTVTTYKHLPNPPGYIPVSPAATGNHSTSKVSKCVQCHADTKSGTVTINGNADISTFPSTTYASTCAACHAAKAKRSMASPFYEKAKLRLIGLPQDNQQ